MARNLVGFDAALTPRGTHGCHARTMRLDLTGNLRGADPILGVVATGLEGRR
jgi:hypothetical protein